MIRKIKIPLEHNKHLVIAFKQDEEGSWSSTLSNECMSDLMNFFKNGYYQLDVSSPFKIEDIEE